MVKIIDQWLFVLRLFDLCRHHLHQMTLHLQYHLILIWCIKAGNWWKVALSGIPISMTSLLYYESVKYLPASIAILGLFQFVWIGVVLDAIATRKMPSLIKIVSVLILMGGTVLAIGIWDNPSVLATLPAKGIIYGFLSGLSYALFIFFNDHYGSDMPAISASALKVTGGAVLLLFILSPLPVVDNILTTDLMWQFGLPTAFLGMVIPTVFFAMAVPKVGVTLSSIISSVELPMAVFFSSLILEETVTFSQWLGVVVILLAIALPQWVKK